MKQETSIHNSPIPQKNTYQNIDLKEIAQQTRLLRSRVVLFVFISFVVTLPLPYARSTYPLHVSRYTILPNSFEQAPSRGYDRNTYYSPTDRIQHFDCDVWRVCITRYHDYYIVKHRIESYQVVSPLTPWVDLAT